MKSRHKLFAQKLQIQVGLQECPKPFRLSHKARTAIRSSQRSWLTTTACMHTRSSTEHQSKNCPLLTHPTVFPYNLSYPKYSAPTAVRLHTTASLTIIQCVQQINWRYIPCTGPCAGINRKMCQPWCITRKLQQKQTAFPPANLSTLPRSAIGGCEVLFTIHESVLNPFKALSLQLLLPASTFSNPVFLVTRCFCILYTILRLLSDFMNSINNRSSWCTHLR
jgi:hypothetical protein